MSIPCRKAFSDILLELAKAEPDILALCTDSRGSVLLDDYAKQLPHQFVEVGIAEQNCIGMAAGLSTTGYKPFVCGPAAFFSMRSAEQVKVDLAYSRTNVKVIGISGGVSYGALGATHHSLQDIALMSAIPDMTVLLPADASQTAALTRTIAKMEGPFYMRMGRGAVPDVYPPGDTFTIGRARILADGSDVLLLAAGETVFHAKEAGMLLAQKGISASVLDLFTLKPFDEDAVLTFAEKARAVVTVEEHSINGGLGSITASLLAEHCPRRMKRIAIPDEPAVTGTSSQIFAHYGLTAANIAQTACSLLAAEEQE